jgi:tRNA (adenine-N(1)-)-methyltransferase non-catalytic subunit
MFDKLPAKVWNLRPDTLGILLSLANVAAHSRVLVLESCQGLVAAAVAERLGGYGTLCCVSADQKPAPLDSVRTLNLTPAERAAICCAPLASLLAAKVGLAGMWSALWLHVAVAAGQ